MAVGMATLEKFLQALKDGLVNASDVKILRLVASLEGGRGKLVGAILARCWAVEELDLELPGLDDYIYSPVMEESDVTYRFVQEGVMSLKNLKRLAILDARWFNMVAR